MLDVNSGRNPYAISAKLHSHYLFGSGVAAKCQTIQKNRRRSPSFSCQHRRSRPKTHGSSPAGEETENPTRNLLLEKLAQNFLDDLGVAALAFTKSWTLS